MTGDALVTKPTWLKTAGFVVLLVVAAGRYAETLPQLDDSFLLTRVRVFDGERVHDDTEVAVEKGIIRAVGSDLTAWRQLKTIDGTGATLIPGLIDAHVHVGDDKDLQEALRFGVTTVLDMAFLSPEALPALRNMAAARMDVADFRSAGVLATAPGGHGTQYGVAIPTVNAAEVADEFVAARRREGSDYLKVVLNGVRTSAAGAPNLDEPRVKGLVDAAHSRGMLAVAHVETIDDAALALASGVDGLAHVWRRGGVDEDAGRRALAQGVFVIATLAVFDGFLPESRAALLADPELQPWVSSRTKEQLGRSFSPTVAVDPRMVLQSALAAVRSLHTQGVRLLVGTDAGPRNPSVYGVSVHRELELLTEAGFSPTEALTAATMRTAEAFGLSDRGMITAGRRADMVLVRGDPTSDITATRAIVRVWRSGVELDRGRVR